MMYAQLASQGLTRGESIADLEMLMYPYFDDATMETFRLRMVAKWAAYEYVRNTTEDIMNEMGVAFFAGVSLYNFRDTFYDSIVKTFYFQQRKRAMVDYSAICRKFYLSLDEVAGGEFLNDMGEGRNGPIDLVQEMVNSE